VEVEEKAKKTPPPPCAGLLGASDKMPAPDVCRLVSLSVLVSSQSPDLSKRAPPIRPTRSRQDGFARPSPTLVVSSFCTKSSCATKPAIVRRRRASGSGSRRLDCSPTNRQSPGSVSTNNDHIFSPLSLQPGQKNETSATATALRYSLWSRSAVTILRIDGGPGPGPGSVIRVSLGRIPEP
jgi:hypothetical protein